MKTIEEKNRLIAEFMGGKRREDGMYFFKSFRFTMADESRLDFHDSWDWLMPVVEKIESMNFSSELKHIPTDINVFQFFSGGAVAVTGKGETKKIATYQAVVQFIEWYNENK